MSGETGETILAQKRGTGTVPVLPHEPHPRTAVGWGFRYPGRPHRSERRARKPPPGAGLAASQVILDCGARGRSRTADTVIFSHVLYQLSYPGIRV